MQHTKELYTTDFLLDRLFNQDSTNTKRFTSKKPVILAQNRKTAIVNFLELCDRFKRSPETVKMFIDAELQVSSSILDDNRVLLLNNAYSQAQINDIFAKYIKKFVVCPQEKCGSGQTNIIKIDRINYIKCDSCGAKKAI